MPTVALVDPDAAISFAKAMVRGIKMKVDGPSKLDEEESEEDEDEGDDVVPKPSAAAAAAVPARSANRRKSSLFADSGRGIKVRARAAASSPRPPALVLSHPTRPVAFRRAPDARPVRSKTGCGGATTSASLPRPSDARACGQTIDRASHSPPLVPRTGTGKGER